MYSYEAVQPAAVTCVCLAFNELSGHTGFMPDMTPGLKLAREAVMILAVSLWVNQGQCRLKQYTFYTSRMSLFYTVPCCRFLRHRD